MSQVRKLLQGNKIPKAQQGYKFILDNKEYTVTDKQLDEINDKLSKIKDVEIRKELSNWTKGIQTGQGFVDTFGNIASDVMLLNDYKKGDDRRLTKHEATTGEAVFKKRSWYVKHAINEASNITKSVLSKSEPESTKTKVKKTTLDLDFNEKDGKKYLSPTAESNLSARKRISDILAHLQAGDSSTYDYSEYNTDAISNWLNKQEGDNKYDAANTYFDNLWTNMSKVDYKYDPDVDDLLKMFGINYNVTVPVVTQNRSNTPVDYSGYKVGDTITIGDKEYKITGIGSDGKFTVEDIINDSEDADTEETEALEQSTDINNSNDLILVQPGDRDDMDWGVIYKGVPYSYESIQSGSELGDLMEQFEKNNRQLWSQGKRYNENSFIKMPSIENFSDWTVGQVLDDGTDLNQFFLNQGITSAALSHIETDSNGNRYFKYYDNFNPHGTYVPKGGNTSKENPWGIRSPYYLIIDKDGNITSTTEDYKSQNEDYSIINSAPKFKDFWNPNSSISENETISTGYQGAFVPSTKTTQFPATFLQSVIINGKKVNVYRLNDGRLYLDDPRYKVKEHKYVTPEELYNLIKTGKKSKFKSGGVVYKSKIKSFNNKFQNVTKGDEGVKLSLKYPHRQTKRTEIRPDGSVIGIIEEQDNLGNISKKEILLQEPVSKTQPEVINQAEINTPNVASEENIESTTNINRSNKSLKLSNSIYNPEYEFIKMPSIKQSEFVVPNIKPVEQKLIPIKINKNKNFNDLVYALEKLVNKQKSGGIIKGKNGITWTSEDDDWLQGYSDKNISDIIGGLDSESSNNVVGKGGFVKSGKDYTKWLLPGLSLARFGLNSHFQNKYYKQAKAALEAGRYEDLPATLNAPDSNNPTLDRALRQNYLERAAGIKPITSDLISNSALVNQRQKQLWDREQNLLSQRSQYDHDIKNEILNIENQNLINRINTSNQNAARRAAINSAIKQQAMELTQRRAQSWDNLGLEFQNNLYKDRQVMLNYNRARQAQALEKAYDTQIDEWFPDARTKYNRLSPEAAAQYYDFEDYLRKSPEYSGIFNQKVNDIAELQENKINEMNKWMYENGLNYSYPRIITGWNTPIGINGERFKKGGRLNGSTRYTLEPDERIWTDNNKATHAAIAKLSENTIKLLLRALK